jgi:hypothetical protein
VEPMPGLLGCQLLGYSLLEMEVIRGNCVTVRARHKRALRSVLLGKCGGRLCFLPNF